MNLIKKTLDNCLIPAAAGFATPFMLSLIEELCYTAFEKTTNYKVSFVSATTGLCSSLFINGATLLSGIDLVNEYDNPVVLKYHLGALALTNATSYLTKKIMKK